LDNVKESRILVAGGSGFIGSQLLRKLIDKKNDHYPTHIRCLTRNKKSLTDHNNNENNIETVEKDLSNYNDCLNSLDGIDIAYYLVHPMEGPTKNWKKFSEKEKTTAENFSRAATQCNVKRIIYLGGLTNEKDENLSQHMLSRKQVGEILTKSKSKVTIFRAVVILGSRGVSFEMSRYLVERLSLMACPKWVKNKTQPTCIGDVIENLSQSIEIEETEGKALDIGVPDIMTLHLFLPIGTTYYFLDSRQIFLKPFWLVVGAFWYQSIIISIYFIRYGAKLGTLVAGVVAWATQLNWIVDNCYIISGYSLISSNPNANETWRYIAGIIIASCTIIYLTTHSTRQGFTSSRDAKTCIQHKL
jgi:uncharacterized protein YbjT (DUF2867 family)